MYIKIKLSNKKLLDKVSKNARKMLGRNWEDIAYETHAFYLKEIEKKKQSR